MPTSTILKIALPMIMAASMSACISTSSGGGGGGPVIEPGPAPVSTPTPPPGINQAFNVTWPGDGRGDIVQRFARGSTATGETTVCFHNEGPRRATLTPRRDGFTPMVASAGGKPCQKFPSRARVTFHLSLDEGPVTPSKALTYSFTDLNGGVLSLKFTQRN